MGLGGVRLDGGLGGGMGGQLPEQKHREKDGLQEGGGHAIEVLELSSIAETGHRLRHGPGFWESCAPCFGREDGFCLMASLVGRLGDGFAPTLREMTFLGMGRRNMKMSIHSGGFGQMVPGGAENLIVLLRAIC